MCYQKNDLQLKGYTDADWGGELNETKSISRHVFFLNKWCHSMEYQEAVMHSLITMKTEFLSLLSSMHEAVWLKHFLVHLDVHNNIVEPVTINYDGHAAIAYTKYPKYQKRENILT